MVSSEKEKVFWIFDFVGQEEANGFEALLPSVYVITKEEVIGLRWKTPIFKQSHQVSILTMDIS